MASLERRVTALERRNKTDGDHCRFVTVEGKQLWLPRCVGGLKNGKLGCTCGQDPS